MIEGKKHDVSWAGADSENHLCKHSRKICVQSCSKWLHQQMRLYALAEVFAVLETHRQMEIQSFLERRKRAEAETREEWQREKREEARIKEAKSPKATANTYGVRVKERHHNRRRGRVQLMIPPIASCSCLWAGSYKVPAVAAACFPRA